MRPSQVLVLPETEKYSVTQEILGRFEEDGILVKKLKTNRVSGITGVDQQTAFYKAKSTVVLAVRKKGELQGCRPSAHYQLPLISGCLGHCQYCYLNTSFGPKPYIRVYVNRQEILEWANEQYISPTRPFVTILEGAATSDPIPLEPWTGSLRETIEYFGKHPFGRFRFVSKFDQVDTLLDANHNQHTRIRFTINTEKVIKEWDKGTTNLQRRLSAARKVAEAGYPYGFLIGPIIAYEGWQKEYKQLIENLALSLPQKLHDRASFELITHRFTPRAKELIQTVYPETTLDLNEQNREWKYGQFGYGKWVYPKDLYAEAKKLFFTEIPSKLPEAKIMYLV